MARTLSGTTTPGQSGPWGNGNEGVLRFPQISNITETLPSDCLGQIIFIRENYFKSYNCVQIINIRLEYLMRQAMFSSGLLHKNTLVFVN